MRLLTLLAVLVCSTSVGQDVTYASRTCSTGSAAWSVIPRRLKGSPRFKPARAAWATMVATTGTKAADRDRLRLLPLPTAAIRKTGGP